MGYWAERLYQGSYNMAYGKTVQDVFEKFITDNDRKIAEGADRNLKVEQLKQQKEAQEQKAAMDRFNQAFNQSKAVQGQENVLADRNIRENEIARSQENINTARQDKLDAVLQKEDFSVMDREDRQQHAMELANLNADNKAKAAAAKASAKSAPKSVSERFLDLNGEQGKAVNSTIMALGGILDAKKASEDGVSRYSLIGDNEFTQARARFVEGLARMQTGAAISADEEKRFVKMLPTVGDYKSGLAEKKFEDMETMLRGRLRRYGFQPGDFEELKGAGASTSGPTGDADKDRNRLQELRSKYGR